MNTHCMVLAALQEKLIRLEVELIPCTQLSIDGSLLFVLMGGI